MELHPLMARAAAEMKDISGAVRSDQLGCATPCREYDVRALLNHLMFWAPVLTRAGRKQSVLSGRDAGELDFTEGDWQTSYAAQLDDLAAAWGAAGAWEGTTRMTGPDIPASFAGTMTLVELLLHGWDLAVATGQDFHCDEDITAAAYQAISQMAEKGRAMGAFGNEVSVPDSASLLDRVLGVSGRDPNWITATPSTR
jgi:uncharacterized protein (TIGR03086 family)